MKARVRTNLYIRAAELRVLDEEGQNIGIMPTKDALALAKERGLDLIEIGPNAVPAIAKIMEYGKFLYLESKKEKKMKQRGYRQLLCMCKNNNSSYLMRTCQGKLGVILTSLS